MVSTVSYIPTDDLTLATHYKITRLCLLAQKLYGGVMWPIEEAKDDIAALHIQKVLEEDSDRPLWSIDLFIVN